MAKKAIEDAGGCWEVFKVWMMGQTVGIRDGEVDFYDWDVERFIGYKCDPNNEPLIEWD